MGDSPRPLADGRAGRRTTRWSTGNPLGRGGLGGFLMDRRPGRQPAGFFELVSAIDADLVELEEPIDGLGVTLSGQIQQSPALIQFFFFSV